MVHEEQDARYGDVDSVRQNVDSLRKEMERTSHELVARVEIVRDEMRAMDATMRERANALMSEIWRRMEVADAHQATEIQRLAEEVARIQRENATVFTLFEEAHIAEVAESSPTETEGEELVRARTPRIPSRQGLFRELERGARDEVIDRVKIHLPRFKGKGPILDIGCGRGEFLEVANRDALDAYGVDIDPEVVDYCRGLGLDARLEDAFVHLEGLKPESLSGVFSAHVVEHLPPTIVPLLFERIADALMPGGVAVIETPNPASFSTHVQSFWRDPEHIRPVPAESLAFNARLAGLIVREVVYLSLPKDQLPQLGVEGPDQPFGEYGATLNHIIDQLNSLLYGPQDYALVAVKAR